MTIDEFFNMIQEIKDNIEDLRKDNVRLAVENITLKRRIAQLAEEIK